MKKIFLLSILFLNLIPINNYCYGKTIRQRLHIPQASSLRKPSWMKRPQSIRSFVPTRKGVQQKWTSLKTSKRLDPVKQKWSAFKTSQPVEAIGRKWQGAKRDHLGKFVPRWRQQEGVAEWQSATPKADPQQKLLPQQIQQASIQGPALPLEAAPPMPKIIQPIKDVRAGIRGFSKDVLKKTKTVVKGTNVTGKVVDTPTQATPVQQFYTAPVATAVISGKTSIIPATAVPASTISVPATTAAVATATYAVPATTAPQFISAPSPPTGGPPPPSSGTPPPKPDGPTTGMAGVFKSITGPITLKSAKAQEKVEQPMSYLHQKLFKRRGAFVSEGRLEREARKKERGGKIVDAQTTNQPSKPIQSSISQPAPTRDQLKAESRQALLGQIAGGTKPKLRKTTVREKKKQASGFESLQQAIESRESPY